MSNPSAEGLFRGVALKRLNSAEQLDQQIRLVPPAMRLLAISVFVIVMAALVWAIFGSVPTRAIGRGVLMTGRGGNFAVSAVSAGLVLDVFVKPGDHVVAGAEIASIEQKLLNVQIDNAMAEVDRLTADLAKTKEINAVQIRHSEEMAARQQSAIDGQMAANQARLDRLRQLITGYEGLRARGMMSESEVLARQEQFDQTALDLANAKAKKIEIDATLQKRRDELADVERRKQADVDAKKAEVGQLRVSMTVGSIANAPISGVVHEVRVGRGEVAAAGEVLATIGEGGSNRLEALILLGGDRRKRVAVGMEAQIMPDGTKREEYGSMRGRVVAVSDGEVSIDHVQQILHNEQLTKRLFGDSSPLMAWVELVPDRNTPSGFAWWSGNGPNYGITPGTVVGANILIEEVRPISLVIPALRKLLSIGG